MNYKILLIMFVLVLLFPINNSVFAESFLIEDTSIEYEIQGGTINDIVLDFDFSSLVINLSATDDGEIQITIPRSLLDAKISSIDDIFFVLVDDFEIIFEEKSANDLARTLLIQFPQSSSVIEIIGTNTITKKTVVEITPEQSQDSGKGGGCLIATATYGSETTSQVQLLREIRDNSLLQTESGSVFMNSFNNFYYSFSPYIADYERENPFFKEMVNIAITPLISSLSILNYVEINSELDVLGYGLSMVILNVGMYFVAPTIIIIRMKKKLYS